MPDCPPHPGPKQLPCAARRKAAQGHVHQLSGSGDVCSGHHLPVQLHLDRRRVDPQAGVHHQRTDQRQGVGDSALIHRRRHAIAVLKEVEPGGRC